MGVAQLVGGLLSGPLADRFGARTLFAASFVASALCYSAVALSSGMVGLYLSRVPTLLQHAMLAARALIAERTDSESRARWLGFVGVAYAVGAAIGPAAGGAIGSVSLPLAAWVSAAGSALSVVIILAAMPSRGQRAVEASVAAAATPTAGEELPADPFALQDAPSAPAGNSADTQQKDGTSKQGNVGASSASMAAAFARVWRTPRVPSLLTGKLLSSLPSATFRAVFPLIALRAYGMDVQAQGVVMSVMGVSAAFSQAVVVSWSEVRSCRQACGCAPSRAPPGVCARRFAAPMRADSAVPPPMPPAFPRADCDCDICGAARRELHRARLYVDSAAAASGGGAHHHVRGSTRESADRPAHACGRRVRERDGHRRGHVNWLSALNCHAGCRDCSL